MTPPNRPTPSIWPGRRGTRSRLAAAISGTGHARRRHAPASPAGALKSPWTPGRLRAVLAAIATLAALLIAGAGWTVYAAFTEGAAPSPNGSPTPVQTTLSPEDRLAQRVLAAAPLEAAQPGARLSTGRTGTLSVPLPTLIGDAGVPTGFPRSSTGALAQLAAINTTALGSASVRSAQAVIDAWAAPGGPTADTWSGVAAVTTLLQAAGSPADGDGLTVEVEPAMGFIKGSVGDDFVIPCIDFVVTATRNQGRPVQVAVADCQRMTWLSAPRGPGGRWVIGAGPEPAGAPSLWPGSQASFDAGYLWIEVPQQ